MTRRAGGEPDGVREQPGSTQRLVRATMLRAGGYWRPLAGVARLLEELGELVEMLASPCPDAVELSFELADLWIITTVICDQYLGRVAEPGPAGRDWQSTARETAEVIIAAGEIARVVNYYDGPKTPRRAEDLPPLKKAIPRFQEALRALADTLGVDLTRAVEAKIAVIHGRDMERFERDDSDPSTADCLEALSRTRSLAADPARGMRLWGAPTGSAQPLGELAAAILPSLRAFARAAPAEHMEGYLLALPGTVSGPGSHRLGALLDALAPHQVTADSGAPTQLRIGGLTLRVRALGAGFVLLEPLAGRAAHEESI